MRRTLVLAAAALFAAPGAAQVTQPAMNTAASDASVAATRMTWQIMTGYVTRAAEQMPEAEYAFQPTEQVRTYGQLIGHIAGAQYMFCALALGEAPRAEGDIERTHTTKAALVQALKESTEFCARAYAQNDADALRPAQIFGQERTRMFALSLNAAHNAEHYGNMVTYLRIRGMVPPSSAPQN